jgi:hypothetical protein
MSDQQKYDEINFGNTSRSSEARRIFARTRRPRDQPPEIDFKDEPLDRGSREVASEVSEKRKRRLEQEAERRAYEAAAGITSEERELPDLDAEPSRDDETASLPAELEAIRTIKKTPSRITRRSLPLEADQRRYDQRSCLHSQWAGYRTSKFMAWFINVAPNAWLARCGDQTHDIVIYNSGCPSSNAEKGRCASFRGVA